MGTAGFEPATPACKACNFDLTLTGTASVWLENCEFGGDVTLDVPYIGFYYTTFDGKFDLTRSGSTSNTAKGATCTTVQSLL